MTLGGLENISKILCTLNQINGELPINYRDFLGIMLKMRSLGHKLDPKDTIFISEAAPFSFSVAYGIKDLIDNGFVNRKSINFMHEGKVILTTSELQAQEKLFEELNQEELDSLKRDLYFARADMLGCSLKKNNNDYLDHIPWRWAVYNAYKDDFLQGERVRKAMEDDERLMFFHFAY